MTIDLDSCVELAVAHIRHLAGEIGGRESCRAAERLALDAASVLEGPVGHFQGRLAQFRIGGIDAVPLWREERGDVAHDLVADLF